MTERFRPYIADFVVLLVMILVGWLYTFGIQQFLDIGLSDESAYLHRGVSVPKGFPNAQHAPIYSLWYYSLSLVRHDPIELYYLNYKAMTVLPALMLFLALRTNSVSRVLSFVLSLGLVWCSANFPTWPKVSHFAVLLLLFGFFVSGLFRDRKVHTFILFMTALVTSYVRPEYFVSFILLGLILAFLSFKALRETRLFRSAVPLGLALVLSMILIQSFGLPLGSGNRSMVAFGQHYARNWVTWHNDQRNPWTNWETIVETDFGDVYSPSEALLTNPSAVARHVFQNVQTLPRELKSMFTSIHPYSHPAHVALKLGILVIVVAGIAHIRRKDLRAWVNRVVANGKYFRFSVLLVLVLLLPVVISVTLIAPRRHYLLMIGVIMGFACTVLLFRNTDQHREHYSYQILAIASLMPLLILRPLSDSQGKTYRPNLMTIRFLRSLDINVPINILEAENGYGTYVGENYGRVAEYDKKGPFARFLADRRINMVVLSARLAQDTRFRDDPEWLSFTSNPSEWRFTRIDVPGVADRSILVKDELLQSKKKWNDSRLHNKRIEIDEVLCTDAPYLTPHA